MHPSTIIPAIIPRSLPHLRDMLERIRPCASAVQIDIIDGIFAPEASWPYREGGSPEEVAELTKDFVVEVDLMVSRPEEVLEAWRGVSRIVVHLESTERMEDILAHRATAGYELGLAFDDDTPRAALEPYIQRVDFIQCMGIDQVGTQGEPFEPQVLKNIRALRAQFPDLFISVDGSVNRETIRALRAAGASRFVVGSAIFGAEDACAAYRELSVLAE